MPKKKIKIKKKKRQEKKWVTPNVRECSIQLRNISKIIKEGNVTEELKTYYNCYKNNYRRMIRETTKIHNEKCILSSNNKTKVMWDIINEELGKDRKELRKIHINIDGVDVKDPKK
ncbi:hypothetical protein R5R35_000715 [Gryllus longicercus]|uniref:Uncharacterized protein n=1 Tax=Gryllus longicercus TaxID=2509291 RepID=A0AAN9YY40_9ORTH